MSWAVSQATPLRRVNITGNLDLTGPGGSLAFGSEIADSRITGTVSSGNALAGEPAQAQYYTRNSVIGSWDGTGVNLVFSGVHGAPASGFDPNGHTTLPQHTAVASRTIPLPRARQVPGVRPLRSAPTRPASTGPLATGPGRAWRSTGSSSPSPPTPPPGSTERWPPGRTSS